MAVSRKDRLRASRRKLRVRGSVKAFSTLPRVSVHRTLKHFHVQIIDDTATNTIASCSSIEFKDSVKGDKKAMAHHIGKVLAERAKEKGITVAVLDRGQHRYHGRVEAFTQGLREGGLQI